MSTLHHRQNRIVTKEPFCLTCLAVPAAIAGAGTAGTGSMVKKSKTRTIVIGVGIAVFISALAWCCAYLIMRR